MDQLIIFLSLKTGETLKQANNNLIEPLSIFYSVLNLWYGHITSVWNAV